MKYKVLDAVVIGGGHAGLCMGYYLKKSGLAHLILEQDKIGNSWASKRWDSFRLNTVNRNNELPGLTGYFSDPDGFCPAREFVSYLVRYAKVFDLQVREHCKVLKIERASGTSHINVLFSHFEVEHNYPSKTVVVASGAQNMPVIPVFSGELPAKIHQLHASQYRNPQALPEGSALVVGSAQSGLQIAEDLIAGGRTVFLSTSRVGRIPRRYREKDTMDWLLIMGFMDHRPEDVPDPAMIKITQPQVSGVGNRGSTVSLQALKGKGARILGTLDHVEGDRVFFQPNAAEHVKFADEFSKRIKGMVDQYIQKSGTEAPPAEPDPADIADETASCASSDPWLNLSKNRISSVIWATGFTGDFSYLKLPVFGKDGSIIHRNGVSETAGVFFIGLPWMRKRKSALIHGIGEDASFICEHLKASIRG